MSLAIYNAPPGEGDEKSRFPKRQIDPWLVANFSVAAGRFRATYSSLESFDDLRIEELSHKICVLHQDDCTMTALGLIAESRGWTQVWVEGPDAFKNDVWVTMNRFGIKVEHDPSADAQHRFASLAKLDDANREEMSRSKRRFKYRLKNDDSVSDAQFERALKKYDRRAGEEFIEAFQEQRAVLTAGSAVYERPPMVTSTKKPA